ncbi:MAG: CHAT domain-containing protein [Candidatus Delongbacteria bacterium]|nr:CHAT domain-containing protein [Candidatus Delongbacteria bacterium]
MKRGLIIFILTVTAVLFSFDIRDYEPKQITTESSRESDVVIKDEKTIFFASDRSGNFDIYKKDLEKETVTKTTSTPGNEYPKYYDGKNILMVSDETDIHGNIYFLSENGDQELVYNSIGKEFGPFIKKKNIFFVSEHDTDFNLVSVRKGKNKREMIIHGQVGNKLLFYDDMTVLFHSKAGADGFNDLFSAVIDEDSLKNYEQITYGRKILTGFDISQDGEMIVYSAVTSDTNGDLKIDRFDNSVLYRLDRAGSYWTDPVQLTSDSYSSRDPKISHEAGIYFISDRRGNDDVWSCGFEGVAPLRNDFFGQKRVSEEILDIYRAEKALSSASGQNDANDLSELLSTALISFNRALSRPGSSQVEMADVYFRIAEIYEESKNYSSAESIYRIIGARYSSNEMISGTAELKRLSAELKRKGVSDSEYSYELGVHLDYLNSLTEKYSDGSVKNQIYLRIGEIQFRLGNNASAGSYFTMAAKNPDGSDNPESTFRLAVTAFANGNIKGGSELLQKAIDSAPDHKTREKYIKEYFSDSTEKKGESTERIVQAINDNNLDKELRSYACMIMGDKAEEQEIKTEYYGEVKKYFVSDPTNVLLKKFSAVSDLKLAGMYIENNMTDEAEGTLKYMIENYSGIEYDIYPALAASKLSRIYLSRADDFIKKKMFDNALLPYYEAYRLDKNNIFVLRGIVDSYHGLGRLNEAVNFFTDEHGEDINNPFLNYALGYAYAVKGSSSRSSVKQDIINAVRYLERAIELKGDLTYAYLTLSFCHEGLYNISVQEKQKEKDKNIALKGIDYIIGPLKFILQTVKIIDDEEIDHNDEAVSVLNRGLSLCDPGKQKELYLQMRLNLANNYYTMGEYAREQALVHYRYVINEGYWFSSQEQKAVVYERTGHCFFTLNNADAEKYYETALKLYKELNDRQSELRVSMRIALVYLSLEDDEGEFIGGFDAFEKYSEIIIKLKSEDNRKALDMIRRNSAFAKFIDEEYEVSSGIIEELIEGESIPEIKLSEDDYIILTLLGLNIPVWKFGLTIGSQYSEGFFGEDELALLYSMKASNYQNLKEFDKVKNGLKKKAEIFREKKNDLALSLIENRLGLIGYFSADYPESIRRFRRSKDLCTKLEFFYAALINENNILKTHIKEFSVNDENRINETLRDTTVYHISYSASEPFDRAEHLNLKGILNYMLFKKLRESHEPADLYRAYRYLISAKDLFREAYDEIMLQIRPGENKSRLSAAILYNLSEAVLETGESETSSEFLRKGREAAFQTSDKLLKWSYLLKLGDHAADPDDKFSLYSGAEKTLSEYLPSTQDYELISGWQEDIKPLYDRLVGICLDKNLYSEAMNYAERYKNRVLLDVYSSRYLDYREQLHNIHIKKIRFNNDEIARYRQRAEILKAKDPEKFADLIKEYEEKAQFYEEELESVYAQIRKSGDERLLQFVSVEDINYGAVKEILGEYKALISIYSFGDSAVYFYLDKEGVRPVKSDSEGYDEVFDGFISKISELDQLFIVPDLDSSMNFNYFKTASEKGIAQVYMTTLPVLSSLKTVHDNENINYSETKICSEINTTENPLSSVLENGGIVYFDKPVEPDPVNPLETLFPFGDKKIRLSEFLKFKMPAYAVVTDSLSEDLKPIDKAVILNSLIFAGAQTVILPSVGERIGGIVEILGDQAREKDILASLSPHLEKLSLSGLTGMNRAEQSEFATQNLRNSLVNGIRYYNSGIYERSSVHFLQALAMARNISDPQELNILKTLISSFSKMKDYKRAIAYGEQLIDYTVRTGDDAEKLKAYDSLSKDHFRNKEYDKSIEYQQKIIEDEKSPAVQVLAAYDMLSVIYAQTKDFGMSIKYKKEYLKRAGMIKSDEIYAFNTDITGKSSQILFNSMRAIMVNYYMQGETDSALYVFDTVLENEELFSETGNEEFARLFESAGLCYFRKASYKKAEELYFESVEMYPSESLRASVYLNLSDVYYYTDRLNDAEKYLDLAGKAGLNSSEMIRQFNTRSLVELKKNNIASAGTFSYRALEKTIETNDRFEESTARVNLAKIMILKGEIEDADKNLTLSRKLSRETGNRKSLTASDFYRGEIFLNNLNKPDSAAFYFDRCLALSIEDGDEYFKSRAQYGKGLALISKKDLNSAEKYLNESLEQSDRFGYNDIYLSSALKLAELYETERKDDALIMLDKLVRRSVGIAVGNENSFSKDIGASVWPGFEKLIHLLTNRKEYDRMLSVLFLRDELMFYDDMKYFTGINTAIYKPEPEIKVSLTELTSALDGETALIFLLPHGNLCNLAVITSSGADKTEFRLTDEIKHFSSKIETKGDFINSAKKAYDQIFTEKLQKLLSGKKNLRIYSSGSLKNYPLEVLFNGKEYLIDIYNISESHSVKDLKWAERSARLPKSLSFVDPFTAESDLVFAQREYSALDFYSGRSEAVKGREATESLLRSPKMKSVDMVHFPVHSFVLGKDSLRTSGKSSYIQLSSDQNNDGRLEFGEITGLDMEGKEVILSGCGTGGRSGYDYYEFFDLSRAFYASGSGLIISSKWKTDDLSASVLMKRYFKYIQSGESPSAALSKAKRDVKLYLNPHPYYWANFRINLNHSN